MIRVQVQGIDAVKARLDAISRDMREKVLRPAINKVAEKTRAEINRAIPEEYAVKASEVRNAVTLRRASGNRIEAVVEIFGSARKRGRSMNLVHFLAAVRGLAVRGQRAKKKDIAALDAQLAFLIKKAGGLKKIEGAFLGNRGRTVFRRVGKARLPIEPLQVIGFSQMFNSRKISRRVIDKINRDLPVEVDRALQMLLAKK